MGERIAFSSLNSHRSMNVWAFTHSKEIPVLHYKILICDCLRVFWKERERGGEELKIFMAIECRPFPNTLYSRRDAVTFLSLMFGICQSRDFIRTLLAFCYHSFHSNRLLTFHMNARTNKTLSASERRQNSSRNVDGFVY